MISHLAKSKNRVTFKRMLIIGKKMKTGPCGQCGVTYLLLGKNGCPTD